jgi:tetratricopeptide (TPR) repeat protein/transcriptional regulator with XRE-family HTH domain
MANTSAPVFGHLLRSHRRAAGLTQEQLAERAGLSARAITALERRVNRAPRSDTLALLLDALDLSIADRHALEAAARGAHHADRAEMDERTDGTHGQPPFVGRLRERAVIKRHLGGDGPPCLVVSGEPGIGKSRLLREARLYARADGLTVLEGGGHRRSGQEPFAPIVEALAHYLADQSPAEQRANLRGCAWLVRLLPELAGMLTPPVAWGEMESEQERRLMFGAVIQLLRNVAGPAGTLLILDDLQWAGPDALELLAALVRAAPRAELRVLCACRDTEVPIAHPLGTLLADLTRESLVGSLRLGPLTADEASDLLSDLLGEMAMSEEPLRERLLARAEGVPFFLVSCAQSVRAGALDGDISEEIPWGVEQSVRQRIALLPASAHELLDVAAVVGRSAPGRLLVQVCELPERDALAVLDGVCQARLLVEDAGGDYHFVHDIMREVVDADLGTTRRKVLHRCVGQALERAPGAVPVEALAYHYARSDTPEHALAYLEQAAERALAQYAHAAAESHLQELIQIYDGQGRPNEAARARERLGLVLCLVACHDRALDALDAAAAVYRTSGDMVALAGVVAQIAWVHARQGAPDAGLAVLEPLLDRLHPDTLPAETLANLYIALGELYMVACRYTEQLRAVERAAEYAREAHATPLLAQATMRRGAALQSLGRLDEACSALEEAIHLADAASDARSLCRTLSNLGIICLIQGQLAEAAAWCGRGLEVAERLGDPTAVAFIGYELGMTAYYQGEWESAATTFERAADLMGPLEESWVSAYALLGQSWLGLGTGDGEAATRALEDVTARAESIGELQVLRHAAAALAERDLLEGRPEAARARLEPLLDRAGQHELHVTLLLPLLAWAQLSLGDHLRATDLAAEGVERARTQTHQLALVDALRIQARVAAAEGRGTAARAALEEALTLARAMPYPYAEAKALYVYGLLLAADGEPERARERFTAALALCDQLGEGLYRPHIERGLAGLR